MGRAAVLLAICRHELRLLRRSPSVPLIFIATPIVLVAFVAPAAQAVLRARGDGSGVLFAVPGLSVVFAFSVTGTIGFSFFREHGWRTWNRLRASPAASWEIAAGKALTGLLVVAFQQIAVFSLAASLYGFRPRGSMLATMLVALSLSAFVVSYSLLVTALSRSVQQLNAISNLGGLMMGGIGGALVPLASLPGWMRSAAPAFPTYWAVQGFEHVVLSPGGLPAVITPMAVLWAYTLVTALLTLRLFRFSDTKVSWA
ncbi:ABC transporter permease [Actinomadura opuntiae]|uniref:ABC transporter permease n=1 Tax=Actinomadura sp. OS1-43 TaxID=604315 RepID=UPI00255AFA1A|nr:ABC transporter permease [Actinomadura sp. OS1-43]MDL4814109.1 ABC transporter permease [Actinomadura sp. OS1-43]